MFIQPEPSMNVHLDIPLHPGQREVYEALNSRKIRFGVLACGRRWGKTYLASALCIAEALRPGRAWWIAPTYKLANVGWNMLRKIASQIEAAGLEVEIRQMDKMIRFAGGGEVWVRSADRPDSLRGESLTMAVLDEAAFMNDRVFDEAIPFHLCCRIQQWLQQKQIFKHFNFLNT